MKKPRIYKKILEHNNLQPQKKNGFCKKVKKVKKNKLLSNTCALLSLLISMVISWSK